MKTPSYPTRVCGLKHMKKKDRFQVFFFKTVAGNQPVKDFLLTERSEQDRKEIGSDISAVQQRFPLGLPLVDKISDNLWEIRSHIPDGICRTFFTIHTHTIILLHSFVKKTKKTPLKELEIAQRRLQEYRRLNSLN
ncbi:MAG: type II toxin-antitoxin system RelE/ParE family toxin [Treponema sp.]|jgi:phage-related protein|nr:type II toxin-antitoxin system RelE/ParE family toxin [Treponema sp.]